jgi:hypothetical protein
MGLEFSAGAGWANPPILSLRVVANLISAWFMTPTLFFYFVGCQMKFLLIALKPP